MAITPLHERAHVRAAVIRIKWPKATNSLSIFIYLARAPRQAKGLSQPAKPARTSLYQRIIPITPSKPAKPARSPLFQRNSSHIPAKPAKPARPPASYRQVTSKLNYEAKTPLQMRQLKIDHFSVELPASYQQVTSKLKYKPNPNYNYVN